LVGNQPPSRFVSRVAIDQIQNRSLDPKVRVEKDRQGALWARNTSVEGSRTRTSESAKAQDSTRIKRDGDSDEIDESDLHNRKQDGPRISVEDRIVILSEFEKLRISL
jgi:hypothetical protein